MNSILLSVLVLCGVKPHRLDAAVAHALPADNEPLCDSVHQALAEVAAAPAKSAHEFLSLEGFRHLAQVVAEDVLKKSKSGKDKSDEQKKNNNNKLQKHHEENYQSISSPGSCRASPINVSQEESPPPPEASSSFSSLPSGAHAPLASPRRVGVNQCEEHHEPLPVLRLIRAAQLFSKQRLSLIVLLGGGTAAGKSTLAAHLASRLGIATVLSTDSVRESLRVNPEAVKATPELLFSTFDDKKSNNDDESGDVSASQRDRALIRRFERQCSAVLSIVDRFLDDTIKKGESVIVEGVHLLPKWMRSVTEKYSAVGGAGAVVVPAFVFVGGSSRHVHRFAFRGSRNSINISNERGEAEEEEEEKEEDATAVVSSSAPTLDPSNNRYVDAFDSIRTVHHWLLSEVGKALVHAAGNIFLSSDDDDEEEEERKEQDGRSKDASSPPPSGSSAAHRIWRRNANAVVKLVRSEDVQEQEQDAMGGSEPVGANNSIRRVMSALAPVIENVNLDRSVNLVHHAIQMWLDADDIGVACANALPPLIQQHHQQHGVTSDSMGQQQHSFSSPAETGGSNTALIFQFLQQRRKERGGMKRKRSSSNIVDGSPFLTDGTSSGDDGGGSLVGE